MNSIGDEDMLEFYGMFLCCRLGVWMSGKGKWQSNLGINFLAGGTEGHISESSVFFFPKESFYTAGWRLFFCLFFSSLKLEK